MSSTTEQQTFVVIIDYVNWSKHGVAGQRVFTGKNEQVTRKSANKWVRKSTHCEIVDTDSFWVADNELSNILKPKY